jgi:hypothetical protein
MVEDKDCAVGLINLIDKPKEWSQAVTKELIEQSNKIKILQLECAATIGLVMTVLALIFKMALGG